jgi:predicted transcriptional regulator
MIIKMQCKHCDCDDCGFAIPTANGDIYINNDGTIIFSDNPDVNTDVNIIEYEQLVNNIDYDKITGDCADCGGNSHLLVEFNDDTVFDCREGEALKKLIEELKKEADEIIIEDMGGGIGKMSGEHFKKLMDKLKGTGLFDTVDDEEEDEDNEEEYNEIDDEDETISPILSMECKLCGSTDCCFQIGYDCSICVDTNGIIVDFDNEDTNYEIGKSIFDYPDLIKNIENDTDVDICGICNGDCDDESFLIIKFTDGEIFDSKETEAFKKLIKILQFTGGYNTEEDDDDDIDMVTKSPIKDMRCKYCNTTKCDFMISYDSTFYVDKYGIITYSYDKNIEVDKSIFDYPDMVAKIKNDEIIVKGSCNGKCEDETDLKITFRDGTKMKHDEHKAFKKLLTELQK